MHVERSSFSIEPKNNLAFLRGLLFITETNSVEFARKKKPSGGKKERRKGRKLPNHIRHEENSGIAIRTWKKKKKKS